MIEDDVRRYESHYTVNPPEWATHVAIYRNEPDDEDDELPGWELWWFINESTRKWSHFNSPVLFPTTFTMFSEGDVDIIPINLNLENK